MTREELIKRLVENRNNAASFLDSVNKKIEKRFEKDVNKVIKRAINDFYRTFKPDYYKRKYSLRSMYKLTIKDGEYTIDYSHKYTDKTHRASNEYIFNLVFVKGWHGGAPGIADHKVEQWREHPNPGIPYWRLPPPGGDNVPYTDWGRRAKQDKPPIERIDEAVDAYEEEFKSIRKQIFKEELIKWLR